MSVLFSMATGFRVELLISFPPPAEKQRKHFTLVSKKLLPKV